MSTRQVAALGEHKKRQFAERAEAWPDWENHGLMFPSRRGTPDGAILTCVAAAP